MRHPLVKLLVFIGAMTASAQTKKAPPAKKPPCEAKVERFIRATAKSMGLKEDFGLQFARESTGQDSAGRSLSTLTAGTFIVGDGYISDSGATAVVRSFDGACDIVKISVSIGGT